MKKCSRLFRWGRWARAEVKKGYLLPSLWQMVGSVIRANSAESSSRSLPRYCASSTAIASRITYTFPRNYPATSYIRHWTITNRYLNRSSVTVTLLKKYIYRKIGKLNHPALGQSNFPRWAHSHKPRTFVNLSPDPLRTTRVRQFVL